MAKKPNKSPRPAVPPAAALPDTALPVMLTENATGGPAPIVTVAPETVATPAAVPVAPPPTPAAPATPVAAMTNGSDVPTVALDGRVPPGPLEGKWDKFKLDSKLIAPNNKRKYTVLIVGTGLAGASAAATLAEQGYEVKCFTFHDSPRRAHSIAAQGGINAAKNYQNDGDSVERLFYDTIKGGDFRSREANVYRLAQVSTLIIDQCVAQGVPFAREYGGLLANRSFGGAQVSRTFYARGQTGQQLLLGAYQALERQIRARRGARCIPRPKCSTSCVIDGHAKGIVTRDLVTGRVSLVRGRHRGARHGRLRQRLLPFDQRQGLQRHGDLPRAQARGISSPTPVTRRSIRRASRWRATSRAS